MRRAVLFDLFNTLVPGGNVLDRAATHESMGVDLGVDPKAFNRLYHEVVPQRFRGELGDLESTVRTLARRLGAQPSDSSVRLACTRRMRLIRRLLWPSAATLTVLDHLREQGVSLGLVSNCSAETPALWKSTPLAERFAVTAFSCELGSCKPEPRIYLAACGWLAVAPRDCLFVGDGAGGELAGAVAVGMPAIQVTELGNLDDPASPWAGPRIERLTELTGPR